MTSVKPATELVISGPRQEIVFIMDDVGGYEQLAATLGTSREVVILQGAGDGLQQIAQALEGRSGIDALHVISHGSASGVALGSLTLGSADVEARQPELAAIGRSLAPDADVMLYGCDAGANAGLADALAIATGADVALSGDLTGAAALGGDWELEVTSGSIETAPVVDAQLAAAWQEVLAIPSATVTFNNLGNFSNQGQAYDTTQNAVYNVNGNSAYRLVIDGAQLGSATYAGYQKVYLGSRNGVATESAVTLSFADGQVFSAGSLKFFNWAYGMPVGSTTQTFVVRGYASDGQLVGSAQTITLPEANSGTLSFSGLTDIQTLKITSSTNGGNLLYFAIDDLAISNIGPAAPGVVSLSSSTVNGTYKVGDTIQVSVAFDQAVVVTGTPQLTLETGSTDRVVNYASGSGSSTLTFSYTVQAGDTSLDLDAFSSAALSLNGGTIRSAGGADADLVLPTPGTAGSLSANESIVIDGVAPTAAITASDTTLKAGETATVTFTFSEDPGASFTLADLAVAGGTLGALSGTGLVRTATFTPTAGTNGGTASITLGSGGYTDAAGNGGATASINLSFDTLAPAAPSAPDLIAGSDSASATDNITSDTTPTFSGTAEAGATVHLYDTDGTTVLGTTTADGSGNWSITSSNLAEGAHTVTVRAVDAAGNTSSASSGLAVTIDTTAPTVAITSDRATLATGETATITFTFSENPGASFTLGDVVVSGGTLGALSGSGATRTATFTPTAGTDDGVASITITANSWADVAGNLGGAGTRPTLTFDTRAPDAPAAPVLEAGSDSGASSSDGITSDTTPTFSGTAEAGATVRLYDTDGTTVLGSTTADGSGNWSITSSLLAEGAHTVTVRAVDAAGNTSSASSGLAVRIDTTAPTVAITSDVATLATGETATITFTFSENPGASFTLGDVAVSGGTLGALSGSGTTRTATFTPTAGTDDGVASITISAGSWQDAAGNTGGAGTRPALTFDTRAPDAPSAPDLQAGSDTGASSSDGITSDTTPTFSGTAEAGATVRLYATDGTTVLRSTTAAVDGSWSLTAPDLAEGTHALTVRAEDAAGNLGAASEALTVVIDTTAPVAGSTPDLADASDTGTYSTDNITADETPTFTGTAEAGALVTLYDANDNVLGQGIATGGTWSITSSALGEGSHLLHRCWST
ncbi:MAG: hypothetical protein K0S48_2834 [Ramlibacter sp.]|nr:hypothetical protein [Ramlibacter sp.]